MYVREAQPEYTNKLLHSNSPYLQQHAHNPVFWYPWGEEAFARAKAEDKPILLSVGYSTCYWCHVMEREVFENASIAALMNDSFINIKVDREELPEVDDLYMTARQFLTQEGGWPNNVFLTPELKPFYAGGTFGATDVHGRPSFPRILEWLAGMWRDSRESIEQTASEVADLVHKFSSVREYAAHTLKDVPALAESLYKFLSNAYDHTSGGFYKAPKFPHENYLNFLLGYYQLTGTAHAETMAQQSLHRMAAGGLYDHVGCGFHRYAVDKDWMVPHFEKMLYNQALLARAYTDHFALTSNPYSADIAKSVLDFVSGPFTSPDGAFYTAFDAETDGAEGAYYAWTAKELQELLEPEEIEYFTRYYALADIPHFPGHKHADGMVIMAKQPLWKVAVEHKTPYVEMAGISGHIFNKLLATRNQRKSPLRDDKIITSWNGLMIDALARAGEVFRDAKYVGIAAKAARFVLAHARNHEGRLQRIVTRQMTAEFNATLEDYAFLIKGLISLARVSQDQFFLNEIAVLLAEMEKALKFKGGGGYHFSSEDPNLLSRQLRADDAAIPSANAIMLHNFIDLYLLTGKEAWLEEATQHAATFLPSINPQALPEFNTLLHALMRLYTITEKSLPLQMPDAVVLQARFKDGLPQAGEVCTLIVELHIAPSWHIYGNKASAGFAPTQLIIEGEGVESVENIIFPAPQTLEEGTQAYLHHAVIEAVIKISQASPRKPVLLTLNCQPCTQKACSAPLKKTLSL